MKKTVSFLVFALFITFQTQSQNFYEWSDPFPLTDSLSDNLNPEINVSSLYYYNIEATFLFWEKPSDTSTTEIWMDNLLDADEPIALLSDQGIQYKNPLVMNSGAFPYPDTLFYLFYETNEHGNWDIYYMMYLIDGTFSDPHPFAVNSGDDIQLAAGGEALHFDNYAGIWNAAAWICEGNLYSRLLAHDSIFYFTNQVIVDSSDCSQPLVTGGGGNWESIMYLRNDSSGKHVYQTYLGNDGNWNDPEVFYDSTTCENLSRIRFYYDPCWSTYIDTSWRIMTKVWNSIETYDISSAEPFDPAGLGMLMGVKSWFPEAWIAVAYEENGVDEIFMTEEAGSGNFLNFSNSGTMNRNPRFFHGEPYPYNSYCWYEYLLWESYRNGHWQIWASKVIQCGGGTDEPIEKGMSVIAHPNPFTHETTISFEMESSGDVLIDVYDDQGRKVDVIANQFLSQGKHQLRWNAEFLPSGIYIIQLNDGKNLYSTKVIKIE